MNISRREEYQAILFLLKYLFEAIMYYVAVCFFAERVYMKKH
jgi:hypothetical protein